MPRISALRAKRPQVQSQPEALPYSIPAPVGGLNARDSLANMPETDALILDNWFPQPSWVEIRKGYSFAATFSGYCATLSTYNSITGANQLYGAVNNSGTRSLFRMDNTGGGAVGAAVVGGTGSIVQQITSEVFDWIQFGTGSAEVLYLVNGSDNPLLYDGTTWWAITPVTATITGITQASSAVVTINTVSVSNPFAIGNTIGFSGVGGMTQINGLTGTVTATGGSSGAWTVTVNINSSAFSAFTSGGTANPYVLTNGPTALSSLSQVVRFKSRLWFIQANSFNVYYLAQNVFAGALTLLNLAPNFQLGGYLQTVVTISIDNSAGLNDYMAFVSNQGEVVVFQGYDPASVTTWSEAAHYRVGRPLAVGRRAWQKVGADGFLITVDGLVPLSKALVTDRSQEQIAVTDKIRSAINTDAKTYGNVSGWQVQLYPPGTKLLVNVPTTVNAASYQYVQNTLSGAWCSFNKATAGWNALCFEQMGDNLYFGSIGFVAQCENTNSDGGVPIQVTALPAFSYFDERGVIKQPTQCQPIFQTNGSVVLGISLNTDFTQSSIGSQVAITIGTQSVWNVGLWSAPTYWGDPLLLKKPWVGLAGAGFALSITMKIRASNLILQWHLTNFLYKRGSPFYG